MTDGNEPFKPAVKGPDGLPAPELELEFDGAARKCKPGYDPRGEDSRIMKGESGFGGAYKAPRKLQLPYYYSNERVRYARFIREFVYPNGQLCFDWLILYKNGTIDARRLSPFARPKGYFPRLDAWLGGDFMNWVPSDSEILQFKRDASCNRAGPVPRYIAPPDIDKPLPALVPLTPGSSIMISQALLDRLEREKNELA